jgi:hypothetical protein
MEMIRNMNYRMKRSNMFYVGFQVTMKYKIREELFEEIFFEYFHELIKLL